MKKLLAILMAVAMLVALAACGGTPSTNKPEEKPSGETSLAGTYKIKVWQPENEVELTKKMIEDFNKSNTDGIVIDATVEAVGESDAATQMITDVEAGGDLYNFAQDQFARLVQAGALSKLGTNAAKIVTEANDPGVVMAAKSGDELYAYPLTSDNGYFLYYDKSVIPEADVDSLEKLIADCEAADKFFSMELGTSAWYLAGFFFGTGCHSNWVTDNDGNFVSVDDDFNSANGLIAAKGMKKLLDSPKHLSASAADGFANGCAVVVTGTWAYNDIKAILGDNLGATDLPSFTVDGKEYHIGSFNGCKLLGVKPQTDAVKAAALHKLAQYLTDEERQMERFNALSWGPSNSNAQKSEAVQANPGLAALLKQGPYSVPQGNIHGSWWDLAKVIADDVKAATDDAGIQAALDGYEAKMAALFTMSDAEKNSFTVIGSINGTNWDTDFEMEETDGVWKTKEAYALKAGEEFKVRQGKSWDVAYPAENFKVEADGTYFIQLDTATETVSLVEG